MSLLLRTLEHWFDETSHREHASKIPPQQLNGSLHGLGRRKFISPLQNRFARAVDAHQKVPSLRGIQPVGHISEVSSDPKYTVNVPSAFSFTLEELTMLLSLFMKPSLPYTVMDQKAPFSGNLIGCLVGDPVIMAAAIIQIRGVPLREKPPRREWTIMIIVHEIGGRIPVVREFRNGDRGAL